MRAPTGGAPTRPRTATSWRRLALASLALALLLAAACTEDEPAEQPAEEPAEATAVATPEPTPTPPTSDAEARQLLENLLEAGPNLELTVSTVERIIEARDYRFIAPFIEIIRASFHRAVQGIESLNVIQDALVAMSGVDLGPHWFGWFEWYAGTDLEPPPGFTAWKGQLMSRIDPLFEGFLYPDAPATIRVEEVVWGGVRVDGIPSLDNPRRLSPEEATYLDPNEPVFGIALNGEAMAYPVRIMDWHELSNDVVGGVPVSLAYCTLCGAAIAFDGRAPDGNTYVFGTSGLLYRTNKLMYDRTTRSLWNQFTGRPVIGSLAADPDAVQLDLLPVVTTSWRDWLEQHPETEVLDVRTGHDRVYEVFGQPYGDYFRTEEIRFPAFQRSDELHPKARVYGLRLGGIRKAWVIDDLVQEQVLNDEFAGSPIVLVAQRGLADVEDILVRIPWPNYDYGGEVRSFERGRNTFSPGADPDTVLDEDGAEWTVTEEALVGPDGERLDRVNGHIAFWLGWFLFFPEAELWRLN
ncbi:MAG: DUF3179 domain-containing protein [Chloroflexi bacterium]|nr:DUF3179 domain-containing protein [Chloroflexota bacterium]